MNARVNMTKVIVNSCELFNRKVIVMTDSNLQVISSGSTTSFLFNHLPFQLLMSLASDVTRTVSPEQRNNGLFLCPKLMAKALQDPTSDNSKAFVNERRDINGALFHPNQDYDNTALALLRPVEAKMEILNEVITMLGTLSRKSIQEIFHLNSLLLAFSKVINVKEDWDVILLAEQRRISRVPGFNNYVEQSRIQTYEAALVIIINLQRET